MGPLRSGYERCGEVAEAVRRAAELSAATAIVDVEPLVAHWASGQQELDEGIELVLRLAGAVPGMRVVCFATNSSRRPSAVPRLPGLRVLYLASAGKPLRTAPYKRLPRPGVVIGDQVATDGLLARRLGYTFLHYRPRLADIPPGPWLLDRGGLLIRPLLFARRNRPARPGPL